MRCPAWLLGLALAAFAWACDEQSGETCPEPPYTCTTGSSCLNSGGEVLKSYTCPDAAHVCCDVP